ncbi:hypothetical protein AMATHDRAFT_62259, partial [Amanita thiersii Skay4041]
MSIKSSGFIGNETTGESLWLYLPPVADLSFPCTVLWPTIAPEKKRKSNISQSTRG